jgi:hypothetical protein
MKQQQLISKCLENNCKECPIIYEDKFDLGFNILCKCSCHNSSNRYDQKREEGIVAGSVEPDQQQQHPFPLKEIAQS